MHTFKLVTNKAAETKYFYLDVDEAGGRLDGSKRNTVYFSCRTASPMPNVIKRFSVGTKNKDLKQNPDGSLAIYVQLTEPTDPLQRANWLPSPKNGDFSSFVRAYWPQEVVPNGH